MEMNYFKQYGAQRSGTNYLKRLIELNFKDVTVFGSILGWKHGMYETGNGKKFTCGSHEEWIDKQIKPDGKVASVDRFPLKYTPEELRSACKELKYLISVKDPYSYVLSFKNFRAKKRDWNKDQVDRWLTEYLTSYNDWDDLNKRYPDRCYIIRYDLLLSNRDSILSSIQSKFNLQRKENPFIDEPRKVNASTDHGLLISKSNFDRDYYIEKKYMLELPEDIIDMITSRLQKWHLARC